VQAGGGTAIVEVRVSSSADDAEERASGAVSLSSSDLELVRDGSDQAVGLRFGGIDVPQGATILNAYVQFQVDERSTDVALLAISGQVVDDAGAFTAAPGDITSRTRTGASVTWSPPAWNVVGASGVDQRTPDIATVIQEIVSQPGWSAGNALVVIVTGSGKRVAESYNGLPSGAPLLHVEYSQP
jgi:hypothetical protein